MIAQKPQTDKTVDFDLDAAATQLEWKTMGSRRQFVRTMDVFSLSLKDSVLDSVINVSKRLCCGKN